MDSNKTSGGHEARNEKRREARYLCRDPAEVRAISWGSAYLPATVLDISRSGLRLEIATGIANNVDIEIKLPGRAVIFGAVRYLQRMKHAYHIGVEIMDVFYVRRPDDSGHIHEDQMLLYLAGRGLTASEVLAVRNHLRGCKGCLHEYNDAANFRKELRTGALAP